MQSLDTGQQVELFQRFLEQNYQAELVKQASKGLKYLVVDFVDLAKFAPDLADLLIENPEDVLAAASLAVERFDLPGDPKGFQIRFRSLPGSQKIMVRNIRSKHIGKFLEMTGIVKQKTDVRPQVTSARFECPSCGNTIPILQLDTKFKEPSRCGCGRKGKFRLVSKELVDAQKIVLEESPDELEGGEQPKRFNIFLKNDLVSPITEKRTNPGAKVRVVGLVKEVPIVLQQGGQSTRFDLMCEANFVEPVNEDFTEVLVNEEEVKDILEFSKRPDAYERLVESLAPSIYGHERIKEALLLQLFGGVRKDMTDGVIRRGDIHVLLIGDPGSGKSQLIRRISKVAPKSRFVSGKGASGTGLTAAVVRDEFLRGWALEAGALPLTNKGICCIDELDKMSRDDTSALHEALEQQTISISKANIQATLRAETTVLAAANPKFGRFDPYEPVAKQLDLPSTLINRFDLIFAIKDMPDKAKDEQMAGFILGLHKDEHALDAVPLKTEFYKKYVSYSRQRCRPILTDEAMTEIKTYFVEMRTSGGGEAGLKAVPISARQLEALVRLSEASARTRLDDKIRRKDARRAIDLVHYCLQQIGMDPQTGKIDIDRFSGGIPASERNQIHQMKELLSEFERTYGKLIDEEELIREAENRGISREKAEEVLQKLSRKGDIYSPKPGKISKM